MFFKQNTLLPTGNQSPARTWLISSNITVPLVRAVLVSCYCQSYLMFYNHRANTLFWKTLLNVDVYMLPWQIYFKWLLINGAEAERYLVIWYRVKIAWTKAHSPSFDGWPGPGRHGSAVWNCFLHCAPLRLGHGHDPEGLVIWKE